ncbi:MAG: hypothetical protein Q8928_02035 [Bacteroidota bacterium]|nr:hypothetical protein [Bacteroidota bacterium]
MTEIDNIALTRQIILKHIDRVFLFGSRACGNARHNSDIGVGIWGSERIPLKQKLPLRRNWKKASFPIWSLTPKSIN